LFLPIFALLINGLTQRFAIAGDFAAKADWPTHLSYPLSTEATLQAINGRLLQPAAAEAFRNMAEAALNDGVRIVLLSGYRSQAQQAHLFYGIAAARGISLYERARVSAPPGFSEHHTGYAIDVADGWSPRRLSPSFGESLAGKWMMANAHRFCFELSFPRGNAQGIAYEPWHWRYVGSAGALRAFAQAREHFPGSPASRLVLAVHGKTLRLDCSGDAQAPQLSRAIREGGAQRAAFADRFADASPHAQVTLPQN
jgi:hypothetical protein